jgi:hypothetical protein
LPQQVIITEPPSYSTVLFKCGRRDLIDLKNKLEHLSYDLEIKSVTSGIRDVNVFYLNHNSYDEQIKDLTENGLLFQPLMRVKTFDGFSNSLEPSDEIGPNTSIYGAISKDNSKLKRFKEYFDSNDDYNIGLMLGYPECCCRAYIDYSRRFPDPIWEIVANSLPESIQSDRPLVLRDIPWDLQIHMRYFGFKIIPFFPCNYRCSEAELSAERWYNLMYSIDPQTTEKLKRLMLEPSTWSLYNSQVLVNRPPSKGNFMGYAVSSYCPQKKEVDFYPI